MGEYVESIKVGTGTSWPVRDVEAHAAIEEINTALAPVVAHASNKNNPHGVTVAQLGIPALSTYVLHLSAGRSVKFSVSAHLLMYGRYQASATAAAVYAFTSYAAIRAPIVTVLSAGTYITVATGGDNTNGWYIEVSNTSTSADCALYLVGNCVPTIIS